MKLLLKHEEILQACVEWAERHHGLTVDPKNPKMLVTICGESNSGKTFEVLRSQVEFQDAVGRPGGPYRMPPHES